MVNHPLNQQDPDQNQQSNNGSVVGDSASMTIEFLRARLLAERSVSRTARQRADELAKRVVELEEQLKIVSLQRKKAEKATADVLAILEDRGVSDLSEEFDSNSDQEIDHFESKVEHNYPEEDHLAGSKMERNQTDEFLGSEIETSLIGRSLSWRSGKDSQVSDRKNLIDSSSKKQSPFSSSLASTKRSTGGKSCRRIRPRETRSTAEECTNGSTPVPQENGDTASAEGCPTSSSSATETPSNSSENQNLNIVIQSSEDLEGRQPEALLSSHLNVHNCNREMEKALEHQAQLIGQFEEEEEAQREWEKKYRENNSSPVSCEHGTTRSDLTEERDEAKANSAPSPVCSNGYIDLEAKSNVENVLITEQILPTSKLSGYEPSPCLQPDVRYFQDREKSSISLSKEEAVTGLETKIHDPVPPDVPDKVGSVLEALQKAKLSLNHKLKASPQSNSRSQTKAIEFPAKDKPEIPFGCAALFKVPSDFYPENALQNSNLLASNPRLSSIHSYTNEGSALNSSNRLTSSYSSETMPRFPSVQPRIGSTLDASLSHRNNFTHNDLNINRGLPARLDTSVPFPSPYAYNSGNTDMYNIRTSYASPINLLYADPMQSRQQPPLSTDMNFVPLNTPYGVDRPFSSTGMNNVPSSYASSPLNYPLYTDPRPQVPSGGERLYSSTGNEAGHSFYNLIRPNMNR